MEQEGERGEDKAAKQTPYGSTPRFGMISH
jgi:hypothetical protein